MMGYYTPFLLLQAFCLYHAYKNNNQQKWYWIILFFPVIGCLIYLYDNFYSKNRVRTVSETVKTMVNSNHRIEQLEKAFRFNDSLSNKINLADAYMLAGRYKEATELYESCLTGFRGEDPEILMKLLSAYFQGTEYTKAILIGEKLTGYKPFKNSEERIALAWAYHFEENQDAALEIFKDTHKPYTNYKHRIEYAKLLLKTAQEEEAERILTLLIEEFGFLKGHERTVNKNLIREAKNLMKDMGKVQ